ncbi:MAG: oligosaccharide flippase family protein [Thiobacillus sp.]|nr:oligosaccharide flippase family protein [Thiobacillus sp.]
MKTQLFANLNWLFADRILRIVGSLVIGIWVARYLGPGNFGLLNFALSFVALFGMVGRLSIDQVAVRELTKFPEREKEILGSTFRLKLWGSLAATVLVLPAAWLAQPDNPLFLLLVAIMAFGILFNALDAIDIFYQARVLSKYVVQARSIAFLILSAIRVGLIFGNFSVLWFALASTMEIALYAGLLVWIYRHKEGRGSGWNWQRSTARHLIKDGWPLIAGSLLFILHTRIDQVMIGQMLGEVHVGLYSAAISISEAWMFVPVLIVQAVMPYFVQLRESDPTGYRHRLIQLYSAMFWAGVAVGIITMLIGQRAIVFLFGEAYSGASAPLVLIIWTGIFVAQALVRGIWVISENLQLFRLFSSLIAVPINIVLNLFWIQKYGIEGAAAASLISIGVGTWLVPLIFKPMRQSNLDMMRSMNPRYLFVRS